MIWLLLGFFVGFLLGVAIGMKAERESALWDEETEDT